MTLSHVNGHFVVYKQLVTGCDQPYVSTITGTEGLNVSKSHIPNSISCSNYTDRLCTKITRAHLYFEPDNHITSNQLTIKILVFFLDQVRSSLIAYLNFF